MLHGMQAHDMSSTHAAFAAVRHVVFGTVTVPINPASRHHRQPVHAM
jgi:hypothetical protein